jgi:hypothetical protein
MTFVAYITTHPKRVFESETGFDPVSVYFMGYQKQPIGLLRL